MPKSGKKPDGANPLEKEAVNNKRGKGKAGADPASISLDPVEASSRDEPTATKKKIRCATCKNFFTGLNSLRLHIKMMHSNKALGDKRSADTDQKAGAPKAAGQAQTSAQTSATAHYCNVCKKYFKKAYGLTNHNNYVHPKSAAGGNGVKEYSCQVCSKPFLSEMALKLHRVKTHENVHKMTCDLCNAVLNSEGWLIRHMKAVHNTTAGIAAAAIAAAPPANDPPRKEVPAKTRADRNLENEALRKRIQALETELANRTGNDLADAETADLKEQVKALTAKNETLEKSLSEEKAQSKNLQLEIGRLRYRHELKVERAKNVCLENLLRDSMVQSRKRARSDMGGNVGNVELVAPDTPEGSTQDDPVIAGVAAINNDVYLEV